MATRPQLISARPAAGGVDLDLAIEPALVHFRGHFPGMPIAPGVAQVDWAVHLAREHLPGADLARFRTITGLKFMRLMRPGARLTLSLAYDAPRRELSFRYADAAGAYSTGRVGFR